MGVRRRPAREVRLAGVAADPDADDADARSPWPSWLRCSRPRPRPTSASISDQHHRLRVRAACERAARGRDAGAVRAPARGGPRAVDRGLERGVARAERGGDRRARVLVTTMPARLFAIDWSAAPSAASSASSESVAARLRSASLLAGTPVLPERSSTSITSVAAPAVPDWPVSVTRASTDPPQAMAVGEPATTACEPVTAGLAAGATPVAAPTNSAAQSAPNPARRCRLIPLPHPRLGSARRDAHGCPPGTRASTAVHPPGEWPGA